MFNVSIRTSVLAGLVAVATALPGAAVAAAASSSARATAALTAAPPGPAITATATRLQRIQTSTWSPPSPDPSDIVYIPGTGLLVSDSEVEEEPIFPRPDPIFADVNLWTSSLTGAATASGNTLTYSTEPAGLGYDAANNRLLVADDDNGTIYVASRPPSTLISSFKLADAGLPNADPESVTVDTSVTPNELYVADAMNAKIYRFSLGGKLLGQLDAGAVGAQHPEGLAYDAARDTLLLLDDAAAAPPCKVFELTKTGQVLNVIDISAGKCTHAAGITLAPSSTGSGRSMYIVDRGLDNDTNNMPKPTDPPGTLGQNDGLLEELKVNLKPLVNAGPDKTVSHSATTGVALQGSARDDGNNGPLSVSWSKVSGPGTVTFTPGNAAATSAKFGQAGTYVLELKAADGQHTVTDTVTVVSSEAPVVDAGPDQTITLPVAATLSGTATDDGQPNPPGTLTVAWSKVSGPGSVTFSPANAAQTTASFSAPGTYVLRLTGDDSKETTSDDVTVTVNAAPVPPPPPPPPPPAPPVAEPKGPTTVVHAVSPRRILDTRRGLGAKRGMLRPGRALTLKVEGRGGFPRAGVDKAMLTVTVLSPRSRGYLTVWPAKSRRPATKSLRFKRGPSVSKLVQTRVGSNGKIKIFNRSSRPLHLRAATNAWAETVSAWQGGAGELTRVAGVLALDTRKAGKALGAAKSRTVRVTGRGRAGVPARGVDAVLIKVVARRPSQAGALTVYPGNRARPRTVSVSFAARRNAANRVVVPVDARGRVKVYNSRGRTHVTVKVLGWVSG